MKLFVLVLNRTSKLDELMTAFAKEKICGATILESIGMARELYGSHHQEEEIPFFGYIRKYLQEERHSTSKTILTVMPDEQVEIAAKIVEEVVGSFDKPDTGIMFTVPIDFARGKGLYKE